MEPYNSTKGSEKGTVNKHRHFALDLLSARSFLLALGARRRIRSVADDGVLQLERVRVDGTAAGACVRERGDGCHARGDGRVQSVSRAVREGRCANKGLQ